MKPQNQELFDLIAAMTGKVLVQSELNDIIHCVQKYCKPSTTITLEEVTEYVLADVVYNARECYDKETCGDFDEHAGRYILQWLRQKKAQQMPDIQGAINALEDVGSLATLQVGSFGTAEEYMAVKNKIHFIQRVLGAVRSKTDDALTIAELKMLVRRLARKLPQDSHLRLQAVDYLRRKFVPSDILREADDIGRVEKSGEK